MANKHKHVSQIVSVNLGRIPPYPDRGQLFLSPEANLWKNPIGGRPPIGWSPPEWGTSYLDRGMAYQSYQCVHMANY